MNQPGKKLELAALTAALVAAGLMAAPAQADIFVGVTAGQSDIGSYEFGTDTVIKNDDSDTAFNIFGGWQLSEHFAVSVGFSDLGAMNVAGSYDGGEGSIGYTDEIEATAIEASMIGILPIGERFSVFAQLGVAQVSQDILYSEPGFTWHGSDDGTNLVFGLGFNFSATDNLGIHVRWVDYGDIGDRASARSGHEQDWKMLGAGITWLFGGN